MTKWLVAAKKADFVRIAEEFHISPVLARIIRNRNIVGDAEINKYLYGTVKDLYNPFLLKDIEKGVSLLKEDIHAGKKIRIMGDYDIDGVCSTYILLRGIQAMKGIVDTVIPHRIKDGYGLNDELIEKAKEDGIDTIITCDNGIAAGDVIKHAIELGMHVIVTDHHEIPFQELEGIKAYMLPKADAVIDPKRPDDTYPFKEICGAVVAYKFVQVLLNDSLDKEDIFEELLEPAAFATVGDVMELRDENRIIVKEGLKNMQKTKNLGLKALMEVCGINAATLKPYHLGFVLGPCLNATGRLDSAKRALELWTSENDREAHQAAIELKALNDERKDLTAKGVEEAIKMVEETALKCDNVLVIYLPKVHESIAGIIAGRIRERYGKPVFVLTDGEDCVKGSGRSIPAYSMYEEMTKCQELFLKYGGHKMAAGLSLPKENVGVFRKILNEENTLMMEDFEEVVHIDVPMPMSYVTKDFVESFSLLEPFGVGNEKPCFAERTLTFRSMRRLGAKQNAGKFIVADENENYYEMVYFGDMNQFMDCVEKAYGKEAADGLEQGKKSNVKLSVVYYPDINEFRGERKLQFVMKYYQV